MEPSLEYEHFVVLGVESQGDYGRVERDHPRRVVGSWVCRSPFVDLKYTRGFSLKSAHRPCFEGRLEV